MTLKQALYLAYSYAKIKRNSVPYALMLHYADLAQKKIASDTFNLQKRIYIKKDDTKPQKVTLPYESIGLHSIIRRGSALPIRYTVVNNHELIIEDYGQFDIYYNVLPKTIDLSTDDNYSFEVNSKIHRAIPFFIAYKIATDPTVADICYNEWKTQNAVIKSYINSKKDYSKYYL